MPSVTNILASEPVAKTTHAVVSRAVALYLARQHKQGQELVERTTSDPARYQQQVLRAILTLNAESTYGREHGFGTISSIAQFQEAVPINTYEELRPYVDRMADGSDPRALTTERVEMFTNTSGTTSKPKLIPVTPAGRRAESRVKNIWLAQLAHDHPGVLSGQAFYMFNRAHEYQTPSSLWVGSNGGLMYKNTSPLLRSMTPVPYEVCEISDYESRYYLILRHLIQTDLSLIVCINPSSTLLIAEFMNQHAEELIKDLYTGGVRDGLQLSEDQYAFFRERLPAKRERARRLARYLARDGKLLPRRVWPKLDALCSWKGPGVNAFIEKCRAWYGDLPVRDVGYGSSEFRTGLCLWDEGSRNIPLPDNYFFEFIPEEDREPYLDGSKRTLMLDELEQGRRYLIIQTGPHGLVRYYIEDIVEVNGFVNRTPTIHFVQKARMVTSITGEKIYETQVIEAMDRIAEKRPELKPSFFVCYCDVDAANYKLCVEFDEPRSAEQLLELLHLFEEKLGEVNIEYPYKRASLRLKDPEIYQLPKGASVRFIQHIGKNSIMDNQAKIPRLSRDVDAHFKVFGIERKGVTA